jgi:hypothetical protein
VKEREGEREKERERERERINLLFNKQDREGFDQIKDHRFLLPDIFDSVLSPNVAMSKMYTSVVLSETHNTRGHICRIALAVRDVSSLFVRLSTITLLSAWTNGRIPLEAK